MLQLDKLVRKSIKNLKPYSSARDEYSGSASVFLDANESPFNAPYNRYPDPHQTELKEIISKLKGVAPRNIFLGNGSDEAIDLLIRAFCEPREDNIIAIDPSYGMYEVCANINDIALRKVKLNADYSLNVDAIIEAADDHSKLVFICSPNNPTGNSLNQEAIIRLLSEFNGLVVLDEAYVDFAIEKSFLPRLLEFSNLVILQTLSKAWGMAGIRLGMAYATHSIISILSKIKYPYNINILTQQKAIDLLGNPSVKESWVKTLLAERTRLREELDRLPFVIEIYPSDANFLLVKMHDARGVYDYLVENEVIVRDRSKVTLCDGTLRITVGSPEENDALLAKLASLIH